MFFKSQSAPPHQARPHRRAGRTASGAGRLMRGHLLGDFELAAVFQIRGNSGCTKRAASDQGLDAGARRAAPDHQIHLGLAHTPFRKLLRLAPGRAEEGSAFVAGDAGGLDVGRRVFFELVMRRHLVALASLLVQPDPPAAGLEVPVLDIHAGGGARTREGVYHEADERATAETDHRRRVDGVEELTGLMRR